MIQFVFVDRMIAITQPTRTDERMQTAGQSTARTDK